MDAGLRAGPRIHIGFSPAEGYRAGRELLAHGTRPTAVFVSSDFQATGVMRACHEAGLSIPGDIAIVSFDGTAEAEYRWPALTTVRQPLREMVTDAVGVLLDEDPGVPSFREYPTSLVVRQSCGCALPATLRTPGGERRERTRT